MHYFVLQQCSSIEHCGEFVMECTQGVEVVTELPGNRVQDFALLLLRVQRSVQLALDLVQSLLQSIIFDLNSL